MAFQHALPQGLWQQIWTLQYVSKRESLWFTSSFSLHAAQKVDKALFSFAGSPCHTASVIANSHLNFRQCLPRNFLSFSSNTLWSVTRGD